MRLRVGSLSELKEKGALPFSLPDGSGLGFVVLSRAGVRAYRDSCPHIPSSGLPWMEGAYLDGKQEHIFCASHGARFRLEDGHCISGPCVGAGLQRLKIELDPTGAIHFAGEDLR